MPGAGSATALYTVENDFGAGPATDPTWRLPGMNVTVNELSIEQALQRARYPDDPTPAGSREGEWEGAAGVGFDLTDDNFHELVFADGGTALPNSLMSVPTATWYLGVDLPDGSTDARTPVGTAVIDATVEYNRGENIRAELTMLYGDEPDDISAPADASIEKPTVDQVYSFHGADFTVDGTAQALMQSASISLSNLARMRRGQNRKPYDAVTGAIEPSFSTDATYTEADQNTLAYGSTSGGGIEIVDTAPGTFTLENGLGETIEYSLSGLQPNTYSWADLVAADTDLSEPIDYHVADVEVA
jgi:hypothetical protein